MEARVILAIAALYLALATAPIVSTQSGPTEPTDPVGFAVVLAENEVPGGIIVPESARALRRSGFSAGSGPIEGTASKEAFRANLSGSVARFNAANGSFRATANQGVVHVRSIDEPEEVREILSRQVYVDESVDIPAAQAVFAKIIPAIRGEELRGIIGAGIMPGPECRFRLDSRIRLPAGERPVIELLDAVVQQAPGLVWLMMYDPDLPIQTLKLGFVCPGGATLYRNVYR